MNPIIFFVRGTPRPKGDYVFLSNGRYEKVSKLLRMWQAEITAAARAQYRDPPRTEAVRLGFTFFIPKPKNLTWNKYGYDACPHAPDLDKLIRAAQDALEGILYTNDAQVVAYDPAPFKFYETEDQPPGVKIEMRLFQSTSSD